MELSNYMSQFTYQMPADIEFGPGVLAYLGKRIQELGASKVLVVTDKGIVKAGILQNVLDVLDADEVPYEVYSEISSEPDVVHVEEGKFMCSSFGCDIIVSVGGGSSLDAGKAISVMMTNEGQIGDYAGLGLLKVQGLKHIAIPTTAGTGSETTIWTVISDKKKHVKFGVGSNYLVPVLSLLDPELTLTLPPYVTAVSGVDALSHALESYINKATQPISEALSERAIALIASSLRTAVHAGNVLEARSNMLLASTMAAMAFNATRLGIIHALAMPLGATGKIAHAEAISVLFPEVMRFNLTANYSKFARLAQLFGESIEGMSLRCAAELGVESIITLLKDVGVPLKLSEFGITEADLPGLAEAGIKTGNIPVNPRLTREQDLVDIMRRSL